MRPRHEQRDPHSGLKFGEEMRVHPAFGFLGMCRFLPLRHAARLKGGNGVTKSCFPQPCSPTPSTKLEVSKRRYYYNFGEACSGLFPN